jgi:dethiobiotin synthetase
MPDARRYFVTGTDTDVGKTRVTAGLARALVTCGSAPTIVKPIQTGVAAGEPGDAARAARLAGCAFVEFERYALPADPWSAALAEGREPPVVRDLARRLAKLGGDVVVEGAGGIAVPLGPGETFADLAAAVGLRTIVVVGLRLGCINHALLSVAFARARGIVPAGYLLVERWGSVGAAYVADVRRAIEPAAPVLGTVPCDEEESVSVEYVATLVSKMSL